METAMEAEIFDSSGADFHLLAMLFGLVLIIAFCDITEYLSNRKNKK